MLEAYNNTVIKGEQAATLLTPTDIRQSTGLNLRSIVVSGLSDEP
jgi:hypothetical protein